LDRSVPELRVRRDDLSAVQLVDDEPPGEPAEGEARLAVERFALTTNTITYAVFGDQLGYWQVFPAPDGWGRVPAWGYARVLASRSPHVAEGARVFGLVPMGTSLTVRPAPHPAGFVDAAEHRSGLAPIYNQYIVVDGEGDDATLVMRPLFATAVLLDLTLADAGFHGATRVVLTSASAKTAYGLAHLLRARSVETVGLTSPARRGWVEGLGLYDQVLPYDALDGLDPARRTVLVDVAGDGAVLRGIHERLGDALARSILVGFTHRAPAPPDAAMPGPAPEFFFAPDAMRAHGHELQRLYARGWATFAPVLERALRIDRVAGGAGVERVYRDLLDGRADPAVGFVAVPS
jgi:hypothetical protein